MTYRPGQQVRVASRLHEGHHRTPGYLKGKVGEVVRVHAAFTNPETRAYGVDGLPKLTLYQVAFRQRDVWPSYSGSDHDRVYADVFDHWLEETE
jgi:nitrile hydratase